MFTRTVSNIILAVDEIIKNECNLNSNYFDCFVNFYVELITYGIICPILVLLFVYNLILNRQLPMLFYVICLIFITYF